MLHMALFSDFSACLLVLFVSFPYSEEYFQFLIFSYGRGQTFSFASQLIDARIILHYAFD